MTSNITPGELGSEGGSLGALPLSGTGLSPTETWREIDGFSSYKVSSLGRIKNVTNGRILRPHDDGRGYWQIGLYGDGRKQTRKVHRLVCRAFHGPPSDRQEVAHLDGDRKNASADNLVWATSAENELHKRAHGTASAGERHGMAKLTHEDASAIRVRAEAGENLSALGREFGISSGHASDIAKGKKWNP